MSLIDFFLYEVLNTLQRDASITKIRQAENSFFGSSQLLHSGILKAEQLGTQNMCEAVSRIFWNLVKTSIVSELEKLKEQLFLLETEWKARDIFIYWSIFKLIFHSFGYSSYALFVKFKRSEIIPFVDFI